ncbi:MAG: hypothetical protein HW406_2243 [Candidatus Brocadiaceae bacterium]|nr:hypothetical protein [Candidatus Brocadiaceae bacterium]
MADASAFPAVVLNESDRDWVINKTLGRKIVSPEILPYEIGNALIKEIYMPTIAMFFGIVVSLYFIDNRKHKRPHIHVKYQDSEAVISIPNVNFLTENCLQPKCDWFWLGLKFTKMNLWLTGIWQLADSSRLKSIH